MTKWLMLRTILFCLAQNSVSDVELFGKVIFYSVALLLQVKTQNTIMFQVY